MRNLANRNDLTAEQLRSLLRYSPRTGLFIWLVASGPRSKIGAIAGYWGKNGGYVHISVAGHLYKAHRLAWLYMTGTWPPDEVDHRNLLKWDNRWRNLRAATRVLNMGNLGSRKNNKSGIKGVCWSKQRLRWVAQIGKAGGGRVNLGHFGTKEEAASAYASAALKKWGAFARVNG